MAYEKNQFLKESDVTAESVFFMKRRQVLKALGISAAALLFAPRCACRSA